MVKYTIGLSHTIYVILILNIITNTNNDEHVAYCITWALSFIFQIKYKSVNVCVNALSSILYIGEGHVSSLPYLILFAVCVYLYVYIQWIKYV